LPVLLAIVAADPSSDNIATFREASCQEKQHDDNSIIALGLRGRCWCDAARWTYLHLKKESGIFDHPDKANVRHIFIQRFPAVPRQATPWGELAAPLGVPARGARLETPSEPTRGPRRVSAWPEFSTRSGRRGFPG